MVIEYTLEELNHMEVIKQSYRDMLIEADPNKRAKLSLQLSSELESYSEECQRKRFEQIASDPQAILEHAQAQVPIILEYVYKDYSSHTLSDDFKKLDIGEFVNGRAYLYSNFAAELVRDELKLHIEALKDDESRLQLLFSYIINGVRDSEYTDNTDIIIENSKESKMKIMRYRRTSLSDISVYGLMNDKLNAQLIQQDGIFKQEVDGQIYLKWAVNQASMQSSVPVYVALSYDQSEIELTKKLTAFDNAVYNAVSTIFFYWQLENPSKPLYVTPAEIWRTMNGKVASDSHTKPSKLKAKRICDSLDKMRFMKFYMDISEEIKAHGLQIDDDRIIGGHYEDYLLNSSKIEFETEKGNTVTGYKISAAPILYVYAEAKNHVLFVPFEMLDTSQTTQDGENVTEFRNYLLQQIQLMKNAVESSHKGKYFKRNNIILLDTIYKDTGISTPEERALEASFTTDNARNSYIRKTRKADRDKIEGILEAWKVKGWIKGYIAINADNTPIKEGKKAKGYEIQL